MKITVKTGKFENINTPLLVVFLFQENRKVTDWLKSLDKIVKGRVSEVFKARDFKGELNESLAVLAPESSGIKRVLLMGMGKKKEFNGDKARQVFGTAAKYADKKEVKRLTMNITAFSDTELKKGEIGRAASEGINLSLYKFTKFKTEDKKKDINVNNVTIHDITRAGSDRLKKGINEGGIISRGVCYTRDLASNPPNIVTPAYLAEEAKTIAKESGLKFTVLNKKKLEELNMNALLGVGKGSHQPPVLGVIEYDCGQEKAETVALVGKGITFDSGGISLKPGRKMEEMKFDMSGAAAVLGTMKIINDLKPKVNVVGVFAAAENLPGGSALKPSDIITAYSGLTIEVINTDAEGRLVLADALAYTVDKYKPDAMLDIATLTGAVVVALGHVATGMLGNNPPLLKKVAAAGELSGDKVWELPIFPEFDEEIKSKYADIKNSNGPGGGTIFGASFLKKFVGKTPWVHLDIAGTAWDVKEKSYLPAGSTGVGVRLFSQLLLNWK
ncbi:MAG: leucyl aminopeptidase [bacterium]|nr:leucyl aminopeptidase [bacterium]